MSRNGKVVVAMSGGVDSSVAACLLKEQGYDCIGVFMRVGVEHEAPVEACSTPVSIKASAARKNLPVSSGVGSTQSPARRLKHGCCSATDAMDARAVAGRLGIPFYALNFRDEFERIIDYFVDEYSRARTPNPCVMCNIHLKFGRLLRYADMMDAPLVATGHYARVVEENGRLFLARSLNVAKDQTYVLFGVQRDDLPRCRFPLGEMNDKAEVRRMASDLGLSVHDKPDSQEICFVPSNDYSELVRERRPETAAAGEIRDSSGRVLGRHEGIVSYTVGQRRGLGLAVGRPIYVTRLDASTNMVTVGSREGLLARGLIADGVNWLVDPPEGPMRAEVKIRHMHAAAAAEIAVCEGGTVRVGFESAQSAITPGQAAVFYADDVVLGGGWIKTALSVE